MALWHFSRPEEKTMAQLGEVTELLADWGEGNREALNRLMLLVFDELRARARWFLAGEREGHTLQPTALVNELYLRLLDRQQADWKGRAHFFAFAARVMRRILVDHARGRDAAKRGGGAVTVTLSAASGLGEERDVELLALDQALERLAELDEEQAKIVELRYFAGLSITETAEVLGLGEATIARRWASARAFLYGQLSA
jgi:RNA polymerase sigma factor (TIGR02999 family)